MDFFEHNKEFRDSELPKWEKLILSLFDNEIPERKEITKRSKIIKVLDVIGNSKASNHLFFPKSGGMDLKGCRKSSEEGCIELDCDYVNIVKPTKLIFQSFPDVPLEWSYFYLETNNLAPSGVYENKNTDEDYSEEVTELRENAYIDRVYADIWEYQGKRLPESARVVIRYFKGSFVIFSKASIYNLADSLNAYSAPHEKLGEDNFRVWIDQLSKKLKEEDMLK